MKTTITVENGLVTIQVDDGEPVAVVPAKAPKMPHKGNPASRLNVRDYLPESKACLVCGTPFKPARYDSRFCSKKCTTKYHNQKNRKKTKLAKIAPEVEVKWCKHCKAHTTHDSAHHPQPPVKAEVPKPLNPGPEFHPGFEKTPEELKTWKPPKAIIERRDGTRQEVAKPGEFADPWNCEMCRNAGDLCDMHAKMQAEGKQPPL